MTSDSPLATGCRRHPRSSRRTTARSAGDRYGKRGTHPLRSAPQCSQAHPAGLTHCYAVPLTGLPGIRRSRAHWAPITLCPAALFAWPQCAGRCWCSNAGGLNAPHLSRASIPESGDQVRWVSNAQARRVLAPPPRSGACSLGRLSGRRFGRVRVCFRGVDRPVGVFRG